LVSGDESGAIILWDLEKKKGLDKKTPHDRTVYAMCTLNDPAYFVSGGDDGKIFVWNSETFEVLHSVSDTSKTILALSPCSMKDFIIGYCDSQIKICTENWEKLHFGSGESATCFSVLELQPGKILCSHLNPDNYVEHLQIWNTQDDTCEIYREVRFNSIYCISKLRNDDVVVGDGAGRIVLFSFHHLKWASEFQWLWLGRADTGSILSYLPLEVLFHFVLIRT
jgi:WD40 repeat protein